MTAAVAVLASAAFCYAGMAALAGMMDRHREVIGSHALRGRATGTLLLALAWLPCALAFGASIGSAAWCGLLGVGAVLLALVLAYRPAHAAGSMLLAAALGVAGLCWQLA